MFSDEPGVLRAGTRKTLRRYTLSLLQIPVADGGATNDDRASIMLCTFPK